MFLNKCPFFTQDENYFKMEKVNSQTRRTMEQQKQRKIRCFKMRSGNVLTQPGTFWLKLVNSNTVPRRRRHREGVRCWDDLGRHAVS
jgi:hypothetical protein